MDSLVEQLFETLDPARKEAILSGLLSKAERIVTTEHEIAVINRLAEKYNLKMRIELENAMSGTFEQVLCLSPATL